MIVTNNPRIQAPHVLIEGDFRDVLLKARDLVYAGHRLMTHPLFASIRMMFSPIRTIVLSDRPAVSGPHAGDSSVIAEAIDLYDRTMGIRNPDWKHADDYAMIDEALYLSAMDEWARFSHGGDDF